MRARSVAAAAAAGLMTLACDAPAPPLPEAARRAGVPADPPAAPEIPGRSDEFTNMEVPPGQLTRALPVGGAWAADDGPAYRSLCLSCHSVSGTSFAVADWRESLHARAGVLCAGCHGTHEGAFVPRPGPDRCLLCHPSQTEEFLASRHGPGTSAGMRCVSCHEAHATDRGLARSMDVCLGCHLDSDHVQGFPESRMGQTLARNPVKADGTIAAADCVYCHLPESSLLAETGDFRNDRVTLHDPAITVARDANDPTSLTREAIEFLVPRCVTCHSERNARHRLENADPWILHWTPLGMPDEVRRRPPPSSAGGLP